MSQYTRSLDELIPKLTKQKFTLLRFLQKNFKYNIDFIETPHNRSDANKISSPRGGKNRKDIFMTEETFELLENSYNLRNRHIISIGSNVSIKNIVLPIETQTIGFIEKSYMGIVETIRQFHIGTYRVDLYVPKYNLVVECDEFGHNDRDKNYETERENYIILQGNTIIRYNPNEPGFDLSTVLRRINGVIMGPPPREEYVV